jgi:hypothetical protein
VKPGAVVEMERDHLNMNVFCAVSRRCVFSPILLAKKYYGTAASVAKLFMPHSD